MRPWHTIYRLMGIVTILGTRGERLPPLPAGLIAELMSRAALDGVLYPNKPIPVVRLPRFAKAGLGFG